MTDRSKRITVALAVGVILTITPFLLPVPSKTLELFHWPAVLVDRPSASWLPLNAGKRVITLLSINVFGWAVSLFCLWNGIKAFVRKES